MILYDPTFTDSITYGRKFSTIRRDPDGEKYAHYMQIMNDGGKIQHCSTTDGEITRIAKTAIKNVQEFRFPVHPSELPEEVWKADGFLSAENMWQWFHDKYGADLCQIRFVRIEWEPIRLQIERYY